MRSVCMCDFCSYIDTEENVKEHEKHCLKNPDVKNCFNCAYAYEMPVVQAWGWGTNGAKSTFCCTYIEKIKKDGVNLYAEKALPDEHICEHYKRGTPGKTIYA